MFSGSEFAGMNRLTNREDSEHLKYEALSLRIKLPDNPDYGYNYPQSIRANIERFFKKNGFPERLMKVTFDDFACKNTSHESTKAALLAYCAKFRENILENQSSSFAMYGPPGTGKTFAAVCVAKEYAWFGRYASYTTVSALAREVRSTFRRDAKESEDSILEKYAKASMLVMDEIGAGTGSDHERAMFTDVISERYNAKRPTILISNLNLKDFKEALGERVTDRMSEDGGFILPVLGESRRRA